jgi:hypothetical protein
MAKFITTIFILCATLSALFGQPKFNYTRDYNHILTQSKNPHSKLFYDTLLRRFKTDDSTLTSPEVLALMIGFTGRPKYKSPWLENADVGLTLLMYNRKYNEAYDSGISLLKIYPLYYAGIMDMVDALDTLCKSDVKQYYQRMGAKIIRAMEYSGDGKSPKTPLFEIDGTDEWGYFDEHGCKPLRDDSLFRYNRVFLQLGRATKNGEKVQKYFAVNHIILLRYDSSAEEAIRLNSPLNKNDLEVDYAYHGGMRDFDPPLPLFPSKIDSVYVRTRNSRKSVNIKINSFEVSLIHKGHKQFLFKCNSNVLTTGQKEFLKELENRIYGGDIIMMDNIVFADPKIKIKNNFTELTIF